ncbi:FkbM family methyltransferase [Mesobacillus jeotgali]|uniref:FkbM family methyltransferase n=1 Tax=Mesobacillus jeotgali TaxID=129985 RepID=UPI001CFD6405|nr:FkbM family methyltransferase [Mesobacillus jeotgali]
MDLEKYRMREFEMGWENNDKIENYKNNVKLTIEKLINDKQYVDALNLIQEYEKIVPNDPDIYSMKAVVLISEEEYEMAENILKEGLLLDNSNSDILFNLGYVYEITQNFNEAYKCYEQVKQLSNDENTINEINEIQDNFKEYISIKGESSELIKRKKALIVAYFFPPLGGSGVQRTLKFAKYLRDYGWEPIVVTPGKTKYPLYDSSLLSDIPQDLNIVRIDEIENIDSSILNGLINMYYQIINNKDLMNQYLSEIRNNGNAEALLLLPDIFIRWAYSVILQIESKINMDEIDVIYTTSGPYSDHLVGYFLKNKYFTPWIADFRDEWTNNCYSNYDLESLRFKLEYTFEKKIVNLADEIITTTPIASENYVNEFNLNKNKVHTITNGYDEEDFEKINISSKKNEKFVIVHNGLFYSIRTPKTFLTAINNLIKKDLIDRSELEIIFTWTEEKDLWEKYLITIGLDDIANFKGYLNHKESLELAAKADALLLILGPGEKNNGVYPGKIFEYLRLCKPILSLSPKGSIVEELLDRTNRGYNADFDNIEEIERHFFSLYKEWKNGSQTTSMKIDNSITVYERKNTTAHLAKIFNNLVEDHSPKKKVAFFSIKNGDKFLHEIIANQKNNYTVRNYIVEDLKQIDEGMEWADICWFEWCDDLVAYGSNLDIAKQRKVICRIHGYEVYTDNVDRVNWENVDKLILISEPLKDFLELRKPEIFNRVSTDIIPNGINLEKYNYRKREKGFNIAFVGSLVYIKNPSMLLEILKSLVEVDKRYKLYIAGVYHEPVIELYMNHQVKELGLEDNYFYEGYQPDINTWLEDKDYLLAASYNESFGFYIAEAMAKGIKPIIHNFPFAKKNWPIEYLYNTVHEAVEMIRNDEYISASYRTFIEKNYSLDKQLLMTEKVTFDLLQEEKYSENEYKFYYKGRTINFYLPNLNDYIQSSLAQTRSFYELEMLEDIYSRNIKDKVVIDVGANIGNHSIFFGKICDAKHVYSFEPANETYNILKKNIEINHLSHKMTSINKGVGRTVGNGDIVIQDSSNLGMNKINFNPEGSIQIVSLDHFFDHKVDQIDLIKIDVEGMGVEVLYGALELIEKFKPLIYIEAESEHELIHIHALLSRYNYELISKFNWTPTYLFKTKE